MATASPQWTEVLAHLDARYGGIATSVPRAAQAAAEAGHHRSTVVALCHPGETLPADAGQASVFPLGRLHWLCNARLRREFREVLGAADAFHVHGLWQEHSSMTANFAVRHRRPFVLSAHGMLDTWAFNHRGLKKRLYTALVERRNMQRATCLRALTETEREDFRRLGLRLPIAVIPNGVDIPDGTADEFLQQFPELRGRRLVLYLGRIHRKKGPDLLCRAWAEIHRGFPDAHLVIAGPDSDSTRREIESVIAERKLGSSVTLPGHLQGTLTWSALRAASVFVLPSHSEGLSRALLEAMGTGLPVVATHACNFAAVAEHGCGLVIDAEQGALERALQQILRAAPADLQTMGQNGERLIRERYSWEVVGRQLAMLYGWILGGGQPPHDLRVEC